MNSIALLLRLASVVPMFVMVGFVSACPPAPKKKPPKVDPPATCVVEANFPTQDARTAVDATLGAPVEGTLCPFRDSDGYRVVVSNAGDVIRMHLSMATNLTAVEPSIIVLKDNGSPAADPTDIQARDIGKSAGEPVDFVTAHRIAEAGTYIVVVRDAEGQDDGFDNFNPYTLVVDVLPDPDSNEPNNTAETATPLSAGTSTGIIATSGDQDWYSVDVPAAAYIIDVTVSAGVSVVEHEVALFGSRVVAGGLESVLLQSAVLAPTAADPTALLARLRGAASDGSAAGRIGEPYFVVVKDVAFGSDTDTDLDAELDPALGTYTLTLAVSADPDEQEGAAGNGDPTLATTITSGQTLNAALATIGDNDFYKVVAPAGTSPSNPRVLVVEATFAGNFADEVDAQLRALQLDPERDSYPSCSADLPCAAVANRVRTCLPDNAGQCGETRMQRFITTSPFKMAYPLRDTNPVYVSVNDFGATDFQQSDGYTIRFDVVDDPDPGEIGEDYLIPNLEEAGYSNGGELSFQRSESVDRARTVTMGYPPVCDETAPVEPCLNLVAVASPVNNGFDALTVDCTDPAASAQTVTLTGRLSYEGDRDYFVVEGYPARGYFGVDFDINLTPTSPVELALFAYNGGQLRGSTLTAAQTGECPQDPDNQDACPAGSICVDGRCWEDGATNAVVPNVDFSGNFGPQGSQQCVVTGGITDGALLIEVVDNGINDFDLAMTYTINVTARCGCPGVCDNGSDFCQDGP